MVLSTLTAALVVAYEVYKVLYRRKGLPPGPLLHPPFLGDGLYLGVGNPLRFLFARFKRYGSIFRIQMMGERIWLINDPLALRPILTDEKAEPFIPITTFKTLMGDDVILRAHAAGAHSSWRKVFLAAVAPKELASLVPRVLDIMHHHMAAWEADGKVHIYSAARAMGLDLSVDAIMQVKLPEGVDRGHFKKQVETFYDGLYALHSPLPGSAFSRALAAKAWLLETLQPGVRELHAEVMKKLDAVDGSIPAYAAQLLDQPSADEGPAAAGSKDPTVAQEAAAATSYPPSLAEKPSIPVAQILHRASTSRFELQEAALGLLHMLVGSGDTTRFALFNIWALVSRSPRVQDKIHQEQLQVIAQYGSELTYQVACHMPYLDATLKECMRILPASGGSMRRLLDDVRVGDYVLPKGDMVWYHAGLLHCTDPALWDGRTDYDVPPHMDWRHNFEHAFRPERWLGGEGEGARPRSYFTFGSGAHLCAGMNLVYLEIKLLLAMVLRKYRLRPECPDMLNGCRLFPFLVPAKGTDGVVLEPR
ncbi:hypothetical protein GPECTOR_1g74 [Gonium pectorale]|uniref:Cytochrome P450 n=1 Tax=Gonium pectorale TaxID=33097 RepID=A0A150H439_GONPE|nr:hypothetical protein GPECTOR_1g74 [Gonium pectorale]|eukprot:KXZ56821.1 hypothetical protein GPECTOR_1g74 [Gonium pectorale]